MICVSIVLIASGFVVHDSSEVKTQSVVIKNKAFAEVLAGKKIAHLSDLHLIAKHVSKTDSLLKKLRSIRPDMILLTGDYVRWYGKPQDAEVVFNFMRKLTAPLGVFAVMGDSDYSLSTAECVFCHSEGGAKLQGLNQTRFLRDSFFDVEIEGRTVRIAGIDCGASIEPFRKIDSALMDSLTAIQPTILLSHSSLAFTKVPEDRHVLTLAGDTHGGQVWLPTFLWKILKRKPDPEHMHGLFQYGAKMLYVTSGVGTSDMHFRFGVPPEIAVFEFE